MATKHYCDLCEKEVMAISRRIKLTIKTERPQKVGWTTDVEADSCSECYQEIKEKLKLPTGTIRSIDDGRDTRTH